MSAILLLSSMKAKTPKGLFDEDFRLSRLTELKDPLVKMNQVVKWEDFRSVIDKAFTDVDYSKGGRPPYDRVMMFKVLVLQKIYGLSDQGIEYHITDRLSFMRFLKLSLADKVVDEKTVWHFRETLTKKGMIDQLFIQLTAKLRASGLIVNEGKIVDAQIISAPIQRNNREENEQIKKGEIPPDWSQDKLRQKDTDARWTEKHGRKFFGYKNHIKIDASSKLIENFETSPANDHDSIHLENLIEDTDKNQKMHADSAYESKAHRTLLKNKNIHCYFHKKAKRNQPLTPKQKQANHIKSRTRARVEHAFGHMTQCIRGIKVRCVGLDRATAQITLTNICYNLQRTIYLITSKKLEICI
jgi:IS5 family transposase